MVNQIETSNLDKTDEYDGWCRQVQIKTGSAYHIYLEISQHIHFETL